MIIKRLSKVKAFKLLFILLLAFFTNDVVAQGGLPVKILSKENREPLISVLVYNKDKSFSIVSDVDGIARIRAVALDEPLYFEYIGFENLVTTLQDIRANGNIVLMENRGFDITQVEIVGSSKAVERRGDIAHQVEVINTKEISLLNPQNSADLLSAGGVYIQKSQMGGGSPIIRGFEANKLLIVIDGVRLNNAIYRNGHLQNVITIDNAILDRTEIVQGPASVIYGSDALGGVMHFFTKEPKLNLGPRDEVLSEGNAYVRYSSANKEKAVHADLNLGGRKVASLTSFTYTDFDDLKAGSKFPELAPEQWRRNYYATRLNGQDTLLRNDNPLVQIGTGYSQVDLLQKIRFQPSNNLGFTLNVQYSTTSNVPRYDQLYQYDLEVQDGDTIPSTRFAQWDYGPQNRLFASLRTRILNEDSKLFNDGSIILSYQRVDEDRITRRFGKDWQENQNEDVYVIGLNTDFLKIINADKNQKILYGTEFTYNRVNSTAFDFNIVTREREERSITRYPNGGSDMTTLAAYVNYRQKFLNKLSFMAGLRYSYIDLSSRFYSTDVFQLPFDTLGLKSSQLTYSTSLAWNIKDDLYLDAVVSTAFRSPNVDDFGKVRAKDGFVTVPNDSLSSEQSLNGEVSLSNLFSDKLRLSGTYYYTYLFDAIVRDNYTLNGMDSLYIQGEWNRVQANVNAGSAYITGVSANMEYTPTKYISLKSSINLVKGWNITAAEPLAHIPPLYGQTSIAYIGKNFELRALARYNGWKRIEDYAPDSSDNDDDATVEGAPAWSIFNIYGSYDLNEKFSINVGVENIMDLHYRPFSSGVSAPGRNFIVTLRGKF